MKTVVHVNQHIIKANKKNGTDDPPITIKNYKGNTKAKEVFINGPSKILYRPSAPLDCGAHVWIETEAEVTTTRPAFFEVKA